MKVSDSRTPPIRLCWMHAIRPHGGKPLVIFSEVTARKFEIILSVKKIQIRLETSHFMDLNTTRRESALEWKYLMETDIQPPKISQQNKQGNPNKDSYGDTLLLLGHKSRQ